jgi:hypothetical protein
MSSIQKTLPITEESQLQSANTTRRSLVDFLPFFTLLFWMRKYDFFGELSDGYKKMTTSVCPTNFTSHDLWDEDNFSTDFSKQITLGSLKNCLYRVYVKLLEVLAAEKPANEKRLDTYKGKKMPLGVSLHCSAYEMKNFVVNVARSVLNIVDLTFTKSFVHGSDTRAFLPDCVDHAIIKCHSTSGNWILFSSTTVGPMSVFNLYHLQDGATYGPFTIPDAFPLEGACLIANVFIINGIVGLMGDFRIGSRRWGRLSSYLLFWNLGSHTSDTHEFLGHQEMNSSGPIHLEKDMVLITGGSHCYPRQPISNPTFDFVSIDPTHLILVGEFRILVKDHKVYVRSDQKKCVMWWHGTTCEICGSCLTIETWEKMRDVACPFHFGQYDKMTGFITQDLLLYIVVARNEEKSIEVWQFDASPFYTTGVPNTLQNFACVARVKLSDFCTTLFTNGRLIVAGMHDGAIAVVRTTDFTIAALDIISNNPRKSTIITDVDVIHTDEVKGRKCTSDLYPFPSTFVITTSDYVYGFSEEAFN